MKKILFLFVSLTMAMLTFGQYTPSGVAMSLMSDGDKSEIEKADKSFSASDRLIKKAEKIEQKYQKYNNSKKRKKYEKKTKEAKKLRVDAQLEKAKGYKKIFEVYLEVVSNGKFHFEADRRSAEDYIRTAEDNASSAPNFLKKYKGKKSSKFKKIRFAAINDDIAKNEDAYQSALLVLEDALATLNEQESKRLNEVADANAWKLAEDENTIASYETYLRSQPNGTYVTDANQRISNLKDEMASAAAAKVQNEITYKVQILADKKAWLKTKVVSIYPSISVAQIFEWFDDADGFFKYAAGEFKSYKEAKILRDGLKNERQDVFIIAFKKGFQIDIVEARTTTNELDEEE